MEPETLQEGAGHGDAAPSPAFLAAEPAPTGHCQPRRGPRVSARRGDAGVGMHTRGLPRPAYDSG